METTELIIWLLLPITLSVFVGLYLKKRKWFSFIKLLIIAVTTGVAGIVLAPTALCTSLVRQAKLGAPCRVQVPVGKGLTTHPYRVLRLWRSSV
jgi:hypothetical protein